LRLEKDDHSWSNFKHWLVQGSGNLLDHWKGWIWQVYFDENAIPGHTHCGAAPSLERIYADYNRQFLLLEFWNRVRNVSRRAVEVSSPPGFVEAAQHLPKVVLIEQMGSI